MTDEPIVLSHRLAEYEAQAERLAYKYERVRSDGTGNWLSVYQTTEYGTVSCSAFKDGQIIANISTASDRPDAVYKLAKNVALMLSVVFDVRQKHSED